MKPRVTKKAYLAYHCIMFCFLSAATILITIWAIRLFSSSEPGPDISEAVTPAHLITPLELQQELNRRGPNDRDPNLVEDGEPGYKTVKAWKDAVNTQYALEMWPE